MRLVSEPRRTREVWLYHRTNRTIAPNGYIGESTRSEIQYAESLGRPVRYVETGEKAAEAWVAEAKEKAERSRTFDRAVNGG
jgi:hypothetical protein